MEEAVHQNPQVEEEKKDGQAPEQQQGVKVSVKHNLKDKTVVLEIGVRSVAFTIEDARGLALALRQVANLVEKRR